MAIELSPGLAAILRRVESQRRAAIRYRQEQGDPVENLRALLSHEPIDQEILQDILDEPYDKGGDRDAD